MLYGETRALIPLGDPGGKGQGKVKFAERASWRSGLCKGLKCGSFWAGRSRGRHFEWRK